MHISIVEISTLNWELIALQQPRSNDRGADRELNNVERTSIHKFRNGAPSAGDVNVGDYLASLLQVYQSIYSNQLLSVVFVNRRIACARMYDIIKRANYGYYASAAVHMIRFASSPG